MGGTRGTRGLQIHIHGHPDEDGVSPKRCQCLRDSVGGMWEMLLVGEGPHARIGVKKGGETRWIGMKMRWDLCHSSESVPDEEDLFGNGYVFE